MEAMDWFYIKDVDVLLLRKSFGRESDNVQCIERAVGCTKL